MTFTLVIEIDEDVTRYDVALALRRAAAVFEKTNGTFESGDAAPVRSTSGDLIGEWNVN